MIVIIHPLRGPEPIGESSVSNTNVALSKRFSNTFMKERITIMWQTRLDSFLPTYV